MSDQAASGLSKALTRPPAAPKSLKRGGKREGAGRPPLEGRLTRCYALTQQHVDIIEQYRVAHGLASASEALRHLLDSAEHV